MRNYWFVPTKWTYYNIMASIKDNDGMADWSMPGKHFEIGDIVFIYLTKPYQCIRYKMEVIEKAIPKSKTLQRPEYSDDPVKFMEGDKAYFRFKLIEEYPDNKFPLSELRKHGLAMPRQIMHIKKEELTHFLGID